MTRDIPEIAKAEHLIVTLEEVVSEAKATIAKHAERLEREAGIALEWGDSMFEDAAKLELYQRLLHYVKSSASAEDQPRKVEFTFDDLATQIESAYKYFSPVAKSTSQCHNLIEAYRVKVSRDFRESTWSYKSFFYNAQRLDPEYQEWYTAESDRREEERRVKEALELLKKKEAAKAKRKAAAAKRK